MAETFFTRRMFLRLLGAASVGAAVPAQARYVEPYALEVTRHAVPLPDLPPELDGLRLVHLTDLHRGPITPDAVLKEAIAVADRLAPDAITITGDFVHGHHRDAAPLARMLTDLRPRFGIWGCLGNHDYGSNATKVTAALETAGVRMLRNEAAPLAPGLWVAGIEDTLRGRPDPVPAMAAVPDGAACIFLTHNPVGVFCCDARPWLVLAGHTHGGQIWVPGLPPRFPPGMEGFPYIAGWGVFDRARLYISRGVGMGMLPLRLFCRPEIALMTLRRGEGVPQAERGLVVRAFERALDAAKWGEKTARRVGDAGRRANKE